MTYQEIAQHISVDPRICFGKPCIRGTRIWVAFVLDLLATGATLEEVLTVYPHLTEADLRACLAYGAETTRSHYFDVQVEAA